MVLKTGYYAIFQDIASFLHVLCGKKIGEITKSVDSKTVLELLSAISLPSDHTISSRQLFTSYDHFAVQKKNWIQSKFQTDLHSMKGQ